MQRLLADSRWRRPSAWWPAGAASLLWLLSGCTTGYRPPDYAQPARLEETAVVVGDNWPLPGVLTCPAAPGNFPAAVLVGGSGSVDRDATSGHSKPYRDLALGLAARGVCVLRYDKRRFAHPQRLLAEAERMTLAIDTVDDALAATALLRRQPKVDAAAVFVIGHSLGGVAIPRIAASAPDVCGFVVMASSPRPVEDLLLPRAQRLAEEDGQVTPTEAERLTALAAAVARVKLLQPGMRVDRRLLPGGLPVDFWLDVRTLAEGEPLRDERRPLLILQGASDVHVGIDELVAWWQLLGPQPNATFRSYAALDHLFIERQADRASDRAGQNVAGAVVEDIAGWIADNRRCARM